MHSPDNSYYDQFASDFEKIPFGETVLNLFGKYSPKTSGVKVLDIGSGPGKLAEWVSQQGFDVTCLDPSGKMIQRCQAKSLHGIQGTLEDLNVDHPFHIALVISSLIHVPKRDFRNQIQKIISLLEPSGLIFISMLLGDGEKWEDPLGKGTDRFFSYFQKSELETIFKEEGLIILETRYVESRKMNKNFALYVLKRNK